MTDATLPGHDERCESEAVGGTSSLGSQVTVLRQPDGAEGRGGGPPKGTHTTVSFRLLSNPPGCFRNTPDTGRPSLGTRAPSPDVH